MIPSLRQAVLLPSVRDPDARDYIRRVEAADGQSLEPSVQRAIDAFVRGCKADGIWNAIKASCILAGARTLSGALVPLVGTAPTNNNFVSGDYNRRTGLLGDGSTKYLSSNRNNNADTQNNKHLSAFVTTKPTLTGRDIISSGSGSGHSRLTGSTSDSLAATINTSVQYVGSSAVVNFIGATRDSSAEFRVRENGQTSTVTAVSSTTQNAVISVFNRASASNYTDARIAFYSIGQSLGLGLLDARVTDLMNAIGAALP